MFGVQARLGPRIRMMGSDGKVESPQPGDDMYLPCRKCGMTFPVRETKVEPELSPIKEPSDGKHRKSRIEGKGDRRKRTAVVGRGNNARLEGNKWEIKNRELNAELKTGSDSSNQNRSNSSNSSVKTGSTDFLISFCTSYKSRYGLIQYIKTLS